MRKNAIRILWLLAFLFLLGAYIFYGCGIQVMNLAVCWIAGAAVLILSVLSLVACIQCIVDRAPDSQGAKALRLLMLVLKMALIPLYVVHFMVTLLMTGLIAAFPMGFFVSPLVVVFGSIFSGILLGGSSFYSLAAIFKTWRAGLLSLPEAVLYSIFQFVYLLDVLFAVAVFFIGRSHEKDAARRANQATPHEGCAI